MPGSDVISRDSPLIARREIVLALASAAAFPALSFAQMMQGVSRIGYLALETHDSDSSRVQQRLLREALRRVGRQESVNLAIEMRFAQGNVERLPSLAADLVRQDVALIVAFFNQAIVAAKNASNRIPIVMVGALSPVDLGLVRSLAHPGGNVTGTTYFSPATTGKLLEILKEAVTAARRVAILLNPTVPSKKFYAPTYELAAAKLGLTLNFFEARSPDRVASALTRISAVRPDALYIVGDSVINPSMPAIAAFALEHKLPSIGTALVHARNGALLYYGPDFENMIERVAFQVDRILAGAKPADLPVEQPSKYELAINLKTAAALGLAIPPSLRMRADRFF
jgi:putative tryptophan/tyrosine transport system substrate-binding protein